MCFGAATFVLMAVHVTSCQYSSSCTYCSYCFLYGTAVSVVKYVLVPVGIDAETFASMSIVIMTVHLQKAWVEVMPFNFLEYRTFYFFFNIVLNRTRGNF
jgi:hypothetical protein